MLYNYINIIKFEISTNLFSFIKCYINYEERGVK